MKITIKRKIYVHHTLYEGNKITNCYAEIKTSNRTIQGILVFTIANNTDDHIIIKIVSKIDHWDEEALIKSGDLRSLQWHKPAADDTQIFIKGNRTEGAEGKVFITFHHTKELHEPSS